MAAPDFFFQDGFDHYAPVNTANQPNISTQLGYEYALVSGSGSGPTIVPPLSGTGAALRLTTATTIRSYSRPFGASFARCIGGFTARINTASFVGITLYDGSTAQVSIGFNNSGQIQVCRGGAQSAVIATSTDVGTPGQVHYVAFDVTVHGSAGIVKVWLNNSPTSLNLSGQDTNTTANNSFSAGGPVVAGGSGNADIDHMFFMCYTASGGSETPPLTSPIIDTETVSSDSSVQFTPAATALGADLSATTATNSPGANQLVVRKVSPGANMTLNSVGILPATTSATAKFKAVLYADVAGAPSGAPVAAGTEVVGTTSGTVLALPFSAGQALTGGTSYWIGYITDTSIAVSREDDGTLGQRAANTYASGAPNPAPAMTSGQPSWLVWGNCTGSAANFVDVNRGYATGRAYNSDNVVGHSDMFNFNAPAATPANIHAVSLRAAMNKTDGGARTVNLKLDSGGTLSNGSNAGISPPLSTSYQSTYWLADPNTGLAFTPSGLVATKGGYEIAS